MKNKNSRGTDGFELVVFDLYDIIIDILEKEGFLEQVYEFEKKKGFDRIIKSVGNLLKINDADSLIVKHIQEHTPEEAVVLLVGIGKCYPIVRSHKLLNDLDRTLGRAPMGVV